jgi:predicted membrane protein
MDTKTNPSSPDVAMLRSIVRTASRLAVASVFLGMIAGAYLTGYFVGYRQAWRDAAIKYSISIPSRE